ncbi:uncharacterized protein VTP21DRAFT_6870 [Calcarisporiella thermophila]|uniref:uncharacterized protein n=1 Tax=Calcarisporiella thermophila TaxID=911321 RepID=UPI003743F1DF
MLPLNMKVLFSLLLLALSMAGVAQGNEDILTKLEVVLGELLPQNRIQDIDCHWRPTLNDIKCRLRPKRKLSLRPYLIRRTRRFRSFHPNHAVASVHSPPRLEPKTKSGTRGV